MKVINLTSKLVREIAPTECQYAEENGEMIMGGIQITDQGPNSFPSGYDLEREAQAKFGAVKISDHGPAEDDETFTWVVIRA